MIRWVISALTPTPAQLFAHHSDQRDWIVEEVLGALVKLSDVKRQQNQYRCVPLETARAALLNSNGRLRNGQSIHVATALLLELIQSCGSPLYGDGSTEAASAVDAEDASELTEQAAAEGLGKAVMVRSCERKGGRASTDSRCRSRARPSKRQKR